MHGVRPQPRRRRDAGLDRAVSPRRLSQPGRSDDLVRIEIGGVLGAALPDVGLCMASHGEPLSEYEHDLVAALRPDHLRADLRLSRAGWRSQLDLAAEAAMSMGSALELALFLGDEPETELDALAADLPFAQARVRRVLVFREGEVVTASRWVRLARQRLAAPAYGATFVGGTDGSFIGLDRDGLDLEGVDAIAYSTWATLDTEGDRSLFGSVVAQGEAVHAARALGAGLPVVVSPVSLRPRAPSVDKADPRQCSLVGAAWTAASLKHLAEAAASSVTYFETTGSLGVAQQGAAFPLYHVLADVGEWEFAQTALVRSTHALEVEALAAHTSDGLRVLIANLTPEQRRCVVGAFSDERASVRALDESTAALAGDDPEGFRARSTSRHLSKGELELELAPFAVIRVDLADR